MNLEEGRAELLRHLGEEIWDRRVLQAMERVPRELFVEPEDRHLAYANIPLPIGYGQTVSQPYIVALMTQSLHLLGTERVLEVGTGSGYQTAVLAQMASHVVSIERFEALAERARQHISLLGYTNVEIYLGDGSMGWPPGAPYQAIIVTAGAPRAPQELVDQLDDHGRLVIPVGSRFDQDLLLLIKREHTLERQNLGPCRFVPLTGEAGWSESAT
ncbi:MAG: protein-L-isoaspartate(D-aspartate) O-methyltransferase [Dehalococcoidia bacterium]|nr:protein-L-isoaspartate(D-aspartate) O-methyltransferase [Dehalococcoidia bacterium]